MATKHFHGRRYQRARANVAIGRMKKRERKLNRIIRGINSIDWSVTIENIINALECFRAGLLALGAKVSNIFQTEMEKNE
jgi:hypothetical protein